MTSPVACRLSPGACRLSLLLLLLLLLPLPASAQSPYPVHIVAILDDATLLGSSGQLYHRSADGSFRRTVAGGLSATLRGAVRGPGDTIIAAGSWAPAFRHEGGVWHARPLPNRGELGAPQPGSSPALVVGRQVYLLDKGGRWKRIAGAPRPMPVIWASGSNRMWVADNQGGLYRSTGGGFAPVRAGLAAGDTIVAMAGPGEAELYALSATGALLALRPGAAAPVAIPPELAGLRIDAVGVAPEHVLVAGAVIGAGGERPVLLRAVKGKLQVEGDLPPLPGGDRVAAVRGTAAGEVLVAGSRGHLLVRRSPTAWTQATVSGDLPPAARRSFPHARPAHTR
jgi:hypothetical protein